MGIPKESAPLAEPVADRYASFAFEPAGPPVRVTFDPDDPPWGLPTAVFTWVASVLLLLVMSLLIISPYVFSQYKGTINEDLGRFLLTDRTAIFLQILAVIPAHLLTIGMVWAVVTRFGKRPFWRTLGWSWDRGVGFWTSAGLAVALLLAGVVLTKLLGGEETQIDHIIASSSAARYTTALVATATAPLVEELIYRGLLYSALQRAIGMLWAVVGVSTLFTIVHVFQYSNNLGVIAAVGMLSIALTLVRALTGRLLPCYVMHLVFNGLQSVLIIFGPLLRQPGVNSEQKAAALMMLAHAFRTLV